MRTTHRTDLVIRAASDDDLPQIIQIYNYYIINTPITFDIEPVSLEDRRTWLARFAATGPYRIFVAENAGVVAG